VDPAAVVPPEVALPPHAARVMDMTAAIIAASHFFLLFINILL